MKAATIFPKCRPGADTAAGHRQSAAHVPLRRPLRCIGPADGLLAEVAADTPARDPLIMHRPPGMPHVLHIDKDIAAALALAVLLMPEIRVTHVRTLEAAREMLQQHVFSAVVIDPSLPDGDPAELLPALKAIPLLVYSAEQPAWRERAGIYLPKPWTSPRRLWTTISSLLGIPTPTCAGD